MMFFYFKLNYRQKNETYGDTKSPFLFSRMDFFRKIKSKDHVSEPYCLYLQGKQLY